VGGDTRVKAIKSAKAMSKKRTSKKVRDDTAELATKKRPPGFSGKNRVAAPGVTHPSDATGFGCNFRHVNLKTNQQDAVY